MWADNMRDFSRLLAYINNIVAGELMLMINRNHPIKLSHKEIKKAEIILSQYPYFNYLEQERKEELERLKSEVDDNIGGSRSSSSDSHVHENKLIKFSDDDVLNKIKRNRTAIESMLSHLEPYQKQIIELSYFQRFNQPNADRIASVANVSRATVFRYRNHFITHLYPQLKL